MSQEFSQSQEPTWTTLPIVKFSHNTSPHGTRNFTWTHVNHRNNIDLTFREVRVVDDYGNYQTRTLMKITSGADILENHDLGDIIKAHQNFDLSTGAEHPVDVVVKTPFLAMRYPKGNNVRRIQVKFHNDLDFTRAWHLLRNIGLPITDRHLLATSVPQQLPSPAPTVSSVTSVSHSGTAINSTSRSASTNQSLATIVGRGSRPSSSSPHKPEFRVPQRPVSTNSDGQFPHLLSRNATPADLPSTRPLSTPFNLSTFTGAPQPSRVSSFHDPPNQSPFIYRSQIERETQSRRLSYPVSIPTGSQMQPQHSRLIGIERDTRRISYPDSIPISQAENKYQPSTSMHVSQMQSQVQSQQSGGLERENGTTRLLTVSPFFPAPKDSARIVSTTSNQGSNESRGMDTQSPSQLSQNPSQVISKTANYSIGETRVIDTQPLSQPSPDHNRNISTNSDHSISEARGINTQPPSQSSQDHNKNLSTTSNYSFHETQGMDTQRPFSTPLILADLDSLWIPPKRELPFLKPRKPSKSSSTAPVAAAPPKPTAQKAVDTSATVKAGIEGSTTPACKPAPKKRVAQRKAPARKKTSEIISTGDSIPKSVPFEVPADKSQEVETSPLAAKSAAAAGRPASAAAVLISRAVPAAKKRSAPARPSSTNKRPKTVPKMVDVSTQTQTLSGRDHTSAQRLESRNTVPELPAISAPTSAQRRVPSDDTPSLVADTPSPASPPQSYLNAIDAFVTKHKARPAPKELCETPGYAEANEEDRNKMVNDFICENLMNGNFLQLCEDVEKSWRRIGLGM